MVHRPSRSTVSTTSPVPSTRLTVSWTGRPHTAAPSRRAAASTRSTSSGATRGRAPSWTTTHSTDSGRASSRRRTDSWRLAPPSTTCTGFRPQAARVASRAAVSPGGAATQRASTAGERCRASNVHWRTGRPARGRKSFLGAGASPPRARSARRIRSPRPAAGTKATTLIGVPPLELVPRLQGLLQRLGPGEDHPPRRGLGHAGDQDLDGLADVLAAAIDNDHGPVVQVPHTLALFLAVADDVDHHLLAREDHRLEGIGQIVHVQDRNPLELGHLVEV